MEIINPSNKSNYIGQKHQHWRNNRQSEKAGIVLFIFMQILILKVIFVPYIPKLKIIWEQEISIRNCNFQFNTLSGFRERLKGFFVKNLIFRCAKVILSINHSLITDQESNSHLTSLPYSPASFLALKLQLATSMFL